METWGWIIVALVAAFVICVICATIARVWELKTGWERPEAPAPAAEKNPDVPAAEAAQEEDFSETRFADTIDGFIASTRAKHAADSPK